MAEKQQQQRMEMEKRLVNSQMKQSALGQTYAFIIAIVFISGAVTCAFYGHEWIAGILGVVGLSGIVSAFIKGRSYRRKMRWLMYQNKKEIPLPIAY